jgi:hypothetical protein
MTRLAIATPRRAHMGTKYVAAANPNGSVVGKLSGCAPGLPGGSTMMAFVYEKVDLEFEHQGVHLCMYDCVN